MLSVVSEPFLGCRRAEFVAALATSGVSTTHDVPIPGAPAIVLSTWGSSARGLVATALDHGADRVVAIGLDERADVGATWALLAAGADDVFAWDPATTPGAVAARLARWREVDALVSSPAVRETLVGESRPWVRFLRQLVEVAAYTASSLLLHGESGTGKELAARLVHALDRREGKRDLVLLDCTTLVPELSGSELFGHERGAFTGAVEARTGAFALADRGTLFLDEVGELPPPLQAQLLRVIQEREYKRVGGNAWQQSRFRLVCATNRDLAREVEAGRFRRDLYHRIASWELRVPALAERVEDVLPLARHFARLFSPGGARLDPALEGYLATRSYPGNVRELRHLVSRVAERHVGEGPLTAGDIPPGDRPATAARDWRCTELGDAIERALACGVGLRDLARGVADLAFQRALSREGGNVQRAARALGVSDRAVQLRRAAGRPHGSGGAVARAGSSGAEPR